MTCPFPPCTDPSVSLPRPVTWSSLTILTCQYPRHSSINALTCQYFFKGRPRGGGHVVRVDMDVVELQSPQTRQELERMGVVRLGKVPDELRPRFPAGK
jgi:hypothetical protein